MSADIITDHALVRWLERVGGIDMEWFRGHVAERCQALVDSGASGGWIDDHWVTIRGGKVISFTPDRPDQRGRQLRFVGSGK